MKLKDRIEELERRVRELEARPIYVPQPVYIPEPSHPVYPYVAPYPWTITWGQTTCSGNTMVSLGGNSLAAS